MMPIGQRNAGRNRVLVPAAQQALENFTTRSPMRLGWPTTPGLTKAN